MIDPSEPDRLAQKRAAARRAVEEVKDGMVVGLGGGSTAQAALEVLAEKVAAGLRVTGVPTSRRTGECARRPGIDLVASDDRPSIDLASDGADQVEGGTLNFHPTSEVFDRATAALIVASQRE